MYQIVLWLRKHWLPVQSKALGRLSPVQPVASTEGDHRPDGTWIFGVLNWGDAASVVA